MKGKLQAINRQLSDLFVSRCIFATENEKLKTRENFEQHFVCSDVNEVVERVIKMREIDESNMIVRIGMDGGGFMKVCLSVFDMHQEKKEQGRLKNRFKDSGVKKLLILAIVPDIQENYINVKRIWLEAGLDKIHQNYTIASDLKLCNILLGLMSHSSSHPCCWCDIGKNDLNNKGTPRTIKSLLDIFWTYFDANTTKKYAKDFGSAIHPSVFADNVNNSTLVVLLVPCYGTDLAPDYKQKINHFKSTYRKLGISTTPKVHAVFYHIIEFCQLMKKGLSPWSEQTLESVHQDFNKVWENYKVRNTEHPEYSERLAVDYYI